MERNGALHKGHRERMRTRVAEAGTASLATHELLEMLLFYVQPQGDTNELAHVLIEQFGSLEGVIEATPVQLAGVRGIKERGACFFSLLHETAKRYATAHLTANTPQALDTPDKVASFLYPFFIGATKEMAYALLLDNAMHPLDCIALGEGSVSEVPLSVRRIAEKAYLKKASAIILAHNHPSGGEAQPSHEDIRITRRMAAALDLLELPLLEHFVFSDGSYAPIIAEIGERELGTYSQSSLLAVLRQMQGERASDTGDLL